MKSSDGQSIEIIDKGSLNSSSGPDFFNAKIKINDTLWAGNVELHTTSSDWLKHNHQKDKAYENVILHVVWEADIPIKHSDGRSIPALELCGRTENSLYNKYRLLVNSSNPIPCSPQLPQIDHFTWISWKERLLVERMESKTEILKNIHAESNNDWNQTFFAALCRSFGMKQNQDSFELLARLTPANLLEKHKDKLTQLEALLFGQSGFLTETFKDEYPLKLKSEYEFLKVKYSLSPMEKHHWKFGKLRPANFPSIRLAQLAALIHRSDKLFSRLLEADGIEEIKKLFEIELSPYWLTHFRFDSESKKSEKRIGPSTMDSIIINLLTPLFFLYGRLNGEEKTEERAFELLNQVNAEKNGIIEKWKSFGVPAENSFDSQALIQLKNEYCSKKQCLKCKIGDKLLRSK